MSFLKVAETGSVQEERLDNFCMECLPRAESNCDTVDTICRTSNLAINFLNLFQSKTFACNFDCRPSGLVIDFRSGFSLYDIPTKVRSNFHLSK